MGSIVTLAVQASMPFAAMLLMDAEYRWRAVFGGAYAGTLMLVGAMSVDPLALQAYAVEVGNATIAMECFNCLP